MGVNTGLYLTDERFAYAKKCAETHHDGKLNAFIAALIDLHRQHNFVSGPDSDNVLVELAKVFTPTIAKKLERELIHVSPPDIAHPLQPYILAKLLEALSRALADEDFDYVSEFDLVDSNIRRIWESTSDERVILATRTLRELLLRKHDPQQLMAAEDQAQYGDLKSTAEAIHRAKHIGGQPIGSPGSSHPALKPAPKKPADNPKSAHR